MAQSASGKAMEQQQSVDTVASAMNQLHASNQEVANAAQEAAVAAQTASAKGQEGSNVIAKASGYMGSLSELLSKTDRDTQALARETEEVGAVLEVIRGVAEQTNLLALNAAIEAARAVNKDVALRWWPMKYAHSLPARKAAPMKSNRSSPACSSALAMSARPWSKHSSNRKPRKSKRIWLSRFSMRLISRSAPF